MPALQQPALSASLPTHPCLPPPSPNPCSDKPVIKKALVDLHGAAFTSYTSMRAIWAIQDWCRSPGPIQVRAQLFWREVVMPWVGASWQAPWGCPQLVSEFAAVTTATPLVALLPSNCQPLPSAPLSPLPQFKGPSADLATIT